MTGGVMLDYEYFSQPTPHIVFPQLLPPDLYEQVRFPEIAIRSKGRSGRDLFVGEPGYEEAIGSVGLHELHDMFTSEEFVRWVISIFADDLTRLHCATTADNATLVPFLETREALDDNPDVLDATKDPGEIFNRFDLAIADPSYTAYVHLDSPRRVLGGVLFFCDAEQDGIDGGEFVLYRDRLFLGDGFVRWPV